MQVKSAQKFFGRPNNRSFFGLSLVRGTLTFDHRRSPIPNGSVGVEFAEDDFLLEGVFFDFGLVDLDA